VSRRSKTPFPGLVREVNVRTKWDYLDQDYVKKLSDAEKQFLSNFNDEFYGGSFNHPGKQLHRSKKKKRECYDRNNARNRDLFAISRATNQLDRFREHVEPDQTWFPQTAQEKYPGEHEDNVLELLDLGLLNVED
jgi:hypothetical protein